MSIRNKLILIFLALTVPPLLIIGALGLSNAEKTVSRLQIERVEGIAALKAKKISAFLDSRIRDAEAVRFHPVIAANLPVLIQNKRHPAHPSSRKAREELDGTMKRIQNIYNLDDIVLTDRNGLMVYMSNHSHAEHGMGHLLPVPDGEVFAAERRQIHVSGIFRNEREGGRYGMFIAAPVSDPEGRFIGSVALEIDLTSITDLMNERTGLGAKGETVLGMKVGEKEFTHLSNDPRYTSHDAVRIAYNADRLIPMQEAVEGRSGAGITTTFRNETIVAAWRPIPYLNVGLVAKVPASEAFAPVRRLRNISMAILASTLFFAVLFAVVIARSVSRPIRALQRGAAAIGSGDLDCTVGTNRRDEIGELSRSFDRMTEELKKTTASRDELAREVSERKRAEAALEKLAGNIKLILNTAGEGLFGLDDEGKHTFVNPAAAAMLGYEVGELIGKHSHSTWHHHREDGSAFPSVECPIYATLRDGEVHGGIETVFWRRDGTPFPAECTSTPILEEGSVKGAVVTFRDITMRKQSEQKIQSHLDRLKALRTIDLAITGSLDLRLTLDIFLDQVIEQLGVDAADVLLCNPHSITLEHAASKGFKTDRIRRISLRMGESCAGRVALDRKPLLYPDITQADCESLPDGDYRLPTSELVLEEDFRAYFGVPLIAKGQVKGVLEVFHRSPLSPEEEWSEFLTALAGQAAIAIDSAVMFDDLQKSHDDLVRAYDTTIEGWARALDYRDKETEGHSRRVTDITVKIARAMGIDDAELVHVRRGALLHDIGKLGVPDAILLKPGKFTDEERAVMEQHTNIAFQLLSPIRYLRPAVDIPYCHHEKWDGTGYPRKLRGEEIPLAARIFAIIDVWDALLSDRPYRPAWPEEKVREHIQSLSGSHFDPDVVSAFFSIISDKR